MVCLGTQDLGIDARALERICGGLYGGVLVTTAPAVLRDLAPIAARHQVTLLCQGSLTDAPRGWAQALRAQLRVFGVGHDPDLARLRLALVAQLDQARPILVCGGRGSPLGQLVEWVQVQKPQIPFLACYPGQAAASGVERHKGLIVHEVGAAHPELLGMLSTRGAQPIPSTVGWWPASATPVPRPDHPAFEAIRTRSEAMFEAMSRLQRLAQAQGLPVLIQGEPGVGKELMARALHRLTGRSGAFVALDLGALEPNLARAELFGHAKGAFTGAQAAHKGAFERAQGGTLFLDEVGNLSLELQASLLRVLQQRKVRPLGAQREIDLDVRIVSATNAHLDHMVRQGEFRADLLGRLNAAVVSLPALRQRPQDFDVLGEAFGPARPTEQPWATHEARALLGRWHWPGNVREFQHVVTCAAALAGGHRPLGVEHFEGISSALAPPGPTLMTHTGEPEDLQDVVPAPLRLELQRACLRLPPWRERSPQSKQFWLRFFMDHRPIEPSVLDRLATMAWWGGLEEIRAALAPLRGPQVRGVIDHGQVDALIPNLLEAAHDRPVRVLMWPTASKGGVGGMGWHFREACILVGRARTLEGLRPKDQRDERGQRAYAELKARLQGLSVGCLSLPWLPRVSRAQCLITRDQDGLVLRHVGGDHLEVSAGPIRGPLEVLEPGEQTSVGQAGQIMLSRSGGEVYAQMFVFEGNAAFVAYGPAALEEDVTRGAALTSPQTLHGPSRQPSGRQSSKPGRVWELQSQEVESLTDIVASYTGGRFSAHIRQASQALCLQGDHHGRLASYLTRCWPRAAQYLGRLYAFEPNEPLRRALRQRYELSDRPCSHLPQPLRQAVGLPT